MNRFALAALCIASLWACSSDEDEKCAFIPEAAPVSLTFEQLEDTVVNFRSKQDMIDFFTTHPILRDFVFGRREFPNDSAFVKTVYARMTNPNLDTLVLETKKSFGDLSQLKKEFQEAFSNLQYYYPNARLPKIQTVVTGLETDLYVSDTLIVVGLDMFLGSEGRFRPKVYDYMLRKYNPENIVPSCMLLYGIDSEFNKTDVKDKTVLADMIAYGKSFYFAKRMMPCVTDSVLIWYTPEEVRGSRKNQDLIWARLVQDQVLYETSHLVKQKYLGERPKTVDVGPECPGRIGQWVGWQIVNAYMKEHDQTTLPELMNMTNARGLFEESNYKPKRR